MPPTNTPSAQTTGLPNPINGVLNFLGGLNITGGLPGGTLKDYYNTVSQMNPGQFGQNVATGVGQLAQGVMSLPKDILTGITQPQTVGPAVTNAVENVGKSLNETAGEPINPKTGQFELPNPQKALKYAYQNPVGEAANILPFLPKGVGEIGDVAEAGKGTEATLPGGAADDIPDNAVKTFKSKYIVPERRAGINDLNTEATSREILAHIKGGMPVTSVDTSPDLITGDNGIVTQMTRDALGNIQGEINIAGNPSQAAGNVLNQVGNKVLFTPQETKSIVQDISRGEVPGKGIYQMGVKDAFDYQKQLESIAAKFRRQSTSLTPNPKAEAMSDAYQAAANSISDEIDKTAGDQQVLKAVKTPERMSGLQQISPRLAQQVNNAQTISDLRTTAKPFVRLSKMQELNQNAANSTFGKVATGMQKPPLSPLTIAGAGIGGAVAGIPGAAILGEIGNVADRVIQPELEGLRARISTPIENWFQSRRLGGIPAAGKTGLPSIDSVAVKGLMSAPLTIMANTPADQNNIKGDQQKQPHTPSIPPSVNGIKTGVQSAKGRYVYTTPQQDGFLTGNQITQQMQALDTKMGQEKLNNPQEYNIDNGKYKALSDELNNPLYQGVITSGSTLNTAAGLGNAAVPLIQNMPLSLANLNKGYDNLLHSTNKDYQGVGLYLQKIQKETGVDFTKATSPSQILNMLDIAMNILNNDYASAKQKYFGGNTLNAGAPTTGSTQLPSMPPVAQNTGLPIGTPVHYGINFGAAGQGVPSYTYNGSNWVQQ